jgi:ABC-2 type transport system ATP-binding protein
LARYASLTVEASGLVKAFGETLAVDGVELAVPIGSVYGFLGPNGAGKSTTIRMLATLVRPDSGTARVLGHDIVREADAVRGRVALTGQFASVDEDLTGMENLVLLGRLLGFPRRPARTRARELLDAFGLAEAAGRSVKTFSGGMRRRLDIAASLTFQPDFVISDGECLENGCASASMGCRDRLVPVDRVALDRGKRPLRGHDGLHHDGH